MKRARRPSESHEPVRKAALVTGTCGGIAFYLERYAVSPEFLSWKGDEVTERMVEEIPDEGLLVLNIRASRKVISFPITSMTEDALNCLQATITEIAEQVRPDIQAADKRAKDDQRERGVSDRRLYQAIPQLHHADGEITFYFEGVPKRFDSDAGLDAPDVFDT